MKKDEFGSLLYNLIFNLENDIKKIESEDISKYSHSNSKKIKALKKEFELIYCDVDNIVKNLIGLIKSDKKRKKYLSSYENCDDYDYLYDIIHEILMNINYDDKKVYYRKLLNFSSKEIDLRKFIGKYSQYVIPKKESKFNTKVYIATLAGILSGAIVIAGTVCGINKIINLKDDENEDYLNNNTSVIFKDNSSKQDSKVKTDTQTSYNKDESLLVSEKNENVKTTKITTVIPKEEINIDEQKEETKSEESKKDDFYTAPDGTIWTSEEEYNAYMNQSTSSYENAYTEKYETYDDSYNDYEEDDFYTAPDGTIWENEEIYNEWLIYNSDDTQYESQDQYVEYEVSENSLQKIY